MATPDTQPLDSRLLNAMKRLRLENIQLQKQLRSLQSDLSAANEALLRGREVELQLAEVQKQVLDLQECQIKVQALEAARLHWDSQRSAITQLAQRQTLELQELRTLLRQRDEELGSLREANHNSVQELERVKHQARQVIVQHYQAMKSAQEQAQQASEEARRSKSQLDAIRPPVSNGRRKVLPPRSLRPLGFSHNPDARGGNS